MAARQGRSVSFTLFAVVLALACAPVPAAAQPAAGKVPRVGLLGVTSAAGYARQLEALRQGFRALGYVEGQNLCRGCRKGQKGGGGVPRTTVLSTRPFVSPMLSPRQLAKFTRRHR